MGRALSKPTFCLLTDFGLTDHYVGVMKGAILSLLPDAQIVDLTHNVLAQNIRVGAFELLAGYKFQPKGTCFVCVVDPGVGTDRSILYAEAGDWKFIAPDNGLLSWVFNETKPAELLKIDVSKFGDSISATFHGRDVMAPLAARILKGESPRNFGKPASSFKKIPFPSVRKSGAQWLGEVLVVDAFGNVVTNFRASEVRPLAKASTMWIKFEVAKATVRGLSRTYSDGEGGKLMALEGSSGFIEIAINQGNASEKTKLVAGDKVTIHFRP